MNKDKRLHKILDTGRSLRLKDLHFHTYWIDSNLTVTPNPVNAVLFQKLVSDLEDLVAKKGTDNRTGYLTSPEKKTRYPITLSEPSHRASLEAIPIKLSER